MDTENEGPTIDALKGEECVRNFQVVGLLQQIDYPVLGVSPEGIVIINNPLPFEENNDDEKTIDKISVTNPISKKIIKGNLLVMIWCPQG